MLVSVFYKSKLGTYRGSSKNGSSISTPSDIYQCVVLIRPKVNWLINATTHS